MQVKKKKTKKQKISAIIIAKDDEKIFDCIKSVSWCNEVIVIDTGLDKKRVVKSRKLGAKVHKYKEGGFNDWRNEGLRLSGGDWVLYIDTDERVTPELKDEITKLIASSGNINTHQMSEMNSYAIPRINIILGRKMKHGGWWPDYVKRLFKKEVLKKWTGDLHEEPVYDGVMGHLDNSLTHIKEDNLADMVDKTNTWSEIEARLMFDSRHPEMNISRFLSAILREFWYRFIKKRAFLDGPEGIMFGIYQVYSRFISYAKLWEMQNINKYSKIKIQK